VSTPTLEQYRGAIYGLAIGDALGWPKEGTGPVHVDGPVSDLPDPALYTDDTQMSLALARALLRAGDDSHETLMQAVAEEFVAWGMSLDNNRAPGRHLYAGDRQAAGGRPLGRGRHRLVQGLRHGDAHRTRGALLPRQR